MPNNVVASNLVFTLPNSTYYEFGVLTSEMHMAWLRTVGGKLESRYRYSTGIVYNNYPWALSISENQRKAVEDAAQAILTARAIYPQAKMADLYDPLTMPPELRKAHEANDKAVDAAYGYKGQNNDEERAAFLFTLYKSMTTLPTIPAKKTRKAK
jgi:hypothetical protein